MNKQMIIDKLCKLLVLYRNIWYAVKKINQTKPINTSDYNETFPNETNISIK